MASREIHLRDELFEELLHNAKPEEEIPSGQTVADHNKPIPVLRTNYQRRLENIGDVMFRTVGGMKWLQSAFADVIKESVMMRLDELSLPERIAQTVQESREKVERETHMFSFNALKWLLRVRALLNLVNDAKNFFSDLAFSMKISFDPRLSAQEELVLLFLSEGEREKFWEIAKVEAGESANVLLQSIADRIFQPVVPKIVAISKEVFWKSIDALLLAISVLKPIRKFAAAFQSARAAGRITAAVGLRGAVEMSRAAVGGVRGALRAERVVITQRGASLAGAVESLGTLEGESVMMRISDAAGKIRSVRIAIKEHKRLTDYSNTFQHVSMGYSSAQDIANVGRRILELFSPSKENQDYEIFQIQNPKDIVKNMMRGFDRSQSAVVNGEGLAISEESLDSLMLSFFTENYMIVSRAVERYYKEHIRHNSQVLSLLKYEGYTDIIPKYWKKTVENAKRFQEQVYRETEKKRYVKYSFKWDEKHNNTGIQFLFANNDNSMTYEITPEESPIYYLKHNDSEYTVWTLEKILNICKAIDEAYG